MQNLKMLEMLNKGQVEELKNILQDELERRLIWT